jgi:hypothetical protein
MERAGFSAGIAQSSGARRCRRAGFADARVDDAFRQIRAARRNGASYGLFEHHLPAAKGDHRKIRPET